MLKVKYEKTKYQTVGTDPKAYRKPVETEGKSTNIQYSLRHGIIHHSDRRITLLSNTDISFGLFNLFTYFKMPFG